MRIRSSVLALFLLGSISSEALAQETSLAEVLYTDAQRLVAAGKTHEACIKFGESQRLDPRLNTLIALAACHEKEGKTASAWGEFVEAREQASTRRDPKREKFARERAATLEGQIHRVVIAVASPPPGIEFTLGGKTLGAGAVGSSIPLDPGDYEVVVTAPGKSRWSKPLHVDASAGEERVEVTLEDVPARTIASSGTIDSTVGLPTSAPERPVVGERPGARARKTSGIVVGAFGGAALLVGGVAGIVAIVNRGDESSACGPGGIGHCNGSDMSAVNGDRAAAVGAGTVADVGLIAGVALVGVGTLLYLLKPSSSARAPMGFVTRFGHGTRGGALEGKW